MKNLYTTLYILLCLPFIVTAQSWEILDIPASPSRFDDVTFINPEIGWAADGYGSILYKTTDGGESWESVLELDNVYMRNIEFLNKDIGFLGTLTPHLYMTSDGGISWKEIDIPGVRAICGLNAIGDSTIYGCGAYFQPAYLIKSTDGGATWSFKDMKAYANALIEVLFLDEETGYAAGSNHDGGIILITNDGGNTWEEIYNTHIPGEVVWKLQRLDSNPNVFFGAVQSFAPRAGKLIKTIDGGKSWESHEVITSIPSERDASIQGVGFITEDYGWMSGHNSGLKLTEDGGLTWNEIHDFELKNINRFFIFNPNLVFAAGNKIYRYTDHVSTQRPTTIAKIHLPKVTIKPNPIQDRLRISIEFTSADHMVITLFDESGNKITQLSRETILSAATQEYDFDFPYSQGLYYIHFHSDRGAESFKVIKH